MLAKRGAGVLLVEISGLGGFAPTRAFCRNHGYREEAHIGISIGPATTRLYSGRRCGEFVHGPRFDRWLPEQDSNLRPFD
jgi:hypothetical protein